jgi:hypothetical protein
MPSIADLHKKHLKQDIYVVGSGPSLRYLPIEFFKDKITIGLNYAYRLFSPTYSLTIHPYIIPIQRKDWNCKWITKTKPTDQSWNLHTTNRNTKYFYLFNNNNNPLDFGFLSRPGASKELYVGCGIQTGALSLAAKMVAANAILCGVDMGLTGGEHHSTDQHTQFHGHSSQQVYDEYYYYTVKLRERLKELYGMNSLSLTPFLGKDVERDCKRLKEFKKLEDLPEPREIEHVKRTTPLVTDFL